MSLHVLLEDPEWDAPVFKKLSRNDTGNSPGHQGGMVIPKDLRKYFPGLSLETTVDVPTVDDRLIADLYFADQFISQVNTRYQYQTWGGTRSPESRLTESLGSIRNHARGDDYILIQRNLYDLEYYRLFLVNRGSQYYQEINNLAGVARWGVLGDTAPMSNVQYRNAVTRQQTFEGQEFQLFDNDATRNEIRGKRIARSIVFRQIIKLIYIDTCCICQTGLKIPGRHSEIEAAHIVPRGENGTDDARNGLSLCKRHHWAFDHGLIGINDDRAIIIPESVTTLPENRELARLRDRLITEPIDRNLEPNVAALRWHRENILLN